MAVSHLIVFMPLSPIVAVIRQVYDGSTLGDVTWIHQRVRRERPMTFHDIRLAVRTLVLDRSVSVVVILCLALGIGVNATLFSVIDGVLVQPLPFPQADRLVVLNEVSERRGIREAGVSYPALQDIRERATSLSAVAASRAASSRSPIVMTRSVCRARQSRRTSSPRSASSRSSAATSVEDDDRPGADPVVMISHDVWQRRYHADPAVVGRSHQDQRHAAHRRRRDAAAIQFSSKRRRCGFRSRRTPPQTGAIRGTCSRSAG